MTGKELWEQYQHYTRDITAHGRVLGFGGVGLCWVFKAENFTFPELIYFALLAFVLYFLADILHPLVAALVLRRFIEREESKLWRKNKTIEGEILKPRWVDYPATFFFLAKCLFLLIGFAFVGFHLVSKIR